MTEFIFAWILCGVGKWVFFWRLRLSAFEAMHNFRISIFAMHLCVVHTHPLFCVGTVSVHLRFLGLDVTQCGLDSVTGFS